MAIILCKRRSPKMAGNELDELWSTLKDISYTLGQAQAFNRTNSFIFMEVIRDLARMSSDPDRYLAGMFERISARADQGPIEKEAHPVNAEFRAALEQFF